MTICSLSLGATPTPLHRTVYDNFGPFDSYGHSGVGIGYHAATGVITNAATSFRPSEGGYLDRMTLGIRSANSVNLDGRNDLVLSLRLDEAGLPGTMLWNKTFYWVTPPFVPSTGVSGVVNLNGPYLNSGQKYWLVAEMPGFDLINTNSWWIGIGATVDSMARISPKSAPGWELTEGTPGRALRVEVLIPEPIGAAPIVLYGLWLTRRRPAKAGTSAFSATLRLNPPAAPGSQLTFPIFALFFRGTRA